MTSRRLIRIKVLQLLYSFIKKEGITLAEIERDLLKSIEKSTDLYYQTLLLMTEIQHRAFLKIDSARNRRFATAEDLNPNVRFSENPILKAIQNNKKFQIYNSNHLISWNDNSEIILYFYNNFIQTEAYQEYMAAPEATFESHKQLAINLLVDFIAQDDIFYQTLEEKNIFWNDDFELVLSIVYKTLKNINEKNINDEDIFFPIYNIAEDLDYARKLLRKSIMEKEENLKIIDKFTQNWEIERISDIDKLIMAIALSEFKNFPSIPLKVTLDEYIEIAKSYSSSKSGSFINGILDKAITLMKENNEITKTGRGLIEQ